MGIVGGALQGIEAAYLSRKAGYETLVLDRREDAPARSLADSSVTVDVAEDPEAALRILSGCDAVIPALENMPALRALDSVRDRLPCPLLFDMQAYSVSSSKQRSNEIMTEIGVPLPRSWPGCGFPVVVKPSCQSGSVGVTVAGSEEEVGPALQRVYDLGDTPVVQEFVCGKSISIEAIGAGSRATAYVTTEVVLDRGYDCKRVLCAPGILDGEQEVAFGMAAKKVAECIGLRGIMDMEAILGRRDLRVLEIDARIPSQTPACVLAGSGINLLTELCLAASGKGSRARNARRCATYEHLWVHDGVVEETGERQFSRVRNPRVECGLFGADEAITDYEPGKTEWRGTFINSAGSMEELNAKRSAFAVNVLKECRLDRYVGSSPEVMRRPGSPVR